MQSMTMLLCQDNLCSDLCTIVVLCWVQEKLVKRCQFVGVLTDTIMTSYSAFTQEKLSVVYTLYTIIHINASWLIGSTSLS